MYLLYSKCVTEVAQNTQKYNRHGVSSFFTRQIKTIFYFSKRRSCENKLGHQWKKKKILTRLKSGKESLPPITAQNNDPHPNQNIKS